MEKVVPFRTGYGSGLCAARYDGSFLSVLFTLSSGAEGHVSGTADYDIFGEPVTETGVFAGSAGGFCGISALVFAYAGKPYDSVTGLSDYGFRDYAPTLARFTTVDPIRDGSNWYAYCNSDPVNFVDMWGLVCIDPSDAKAAADRVAATGKSYKLDGYSWTDNSGTNYKMDTADMAKKISSNIDVFDDSDPAKAYFSNMNPQDRETAIKNVLDDVTVVTGVSRTEAYNAMVDPKIGIDTDMAAGFTKGDAFTVAGYIMIYQNVDYDSYLITHESIHILQEYVINEINHQSYLTVYTNEAETLKKNSPGSTDWYYKHTLEKSAYAFGPENTRGNGGKYVR